MSTPSRCAATEPSGRDPPAEPPWGAPALRSSSSNCITAAWSWFPAAGGPKKDGFGAMEEAGSDAD